MKFIAWLALGLLLGPSFIALPPPAGWGVASQVAGALFLFLAGWEMRFLDLKTDRRFYILLFIGSFLIPVAAGLIFFNGNLFLGVALGISALPVAIQILKEKGLYESSLARRAITLASLCDLVAWVVLAYLLPRGHVSSWIFSHWVVFAFFGGLLVGRFRPLPMVRPIQILQSWLLAPLFFVGLGWKIDLLALFDLKTFLAILAVGVLAKSLGVYFFSRGAGESHPVAWNLAALLNARGAMEVLAAHYAYNAGIIDGAIFSSLVLLGIVTSVIAVPAVRRP